LLGVFPARTEQYGVLLRYQSLGDKEPHVFKADDFHDAHLEGYQPKKSS